MQSFQPQRQLAAAEQGNNSPASRNEQRINAKLFAFGIVEIVLGIGSAILSIVVLCELSSKKSYLTSYYYSDTTRTLNEMATGIWCGAVLFTTGICGMLAKRNRRMGCKGIGLYDINVSMSSVSSALQAAQLMISVFAAATTHNCTVLQILHGMIAFVGFFGMIIAVWHMACCQSVSCCRSEQRPKRPAAVYTAHPAVQPQQYVQLANGQVVMLQMQPLLQGYHPVNNAVPVMAMPNASHQFVYMPAPPAMTGLVPPMAGAVPQMTTTVPLSGASTAPAQQNAQQAVSSMPAPPAVPQAESQVPTAQNVQVQQETDVTANSGGQPKETGPPPAYEQV